MQGAIEAEHLHRYLLAAPLVAGRDVLDIASGEGYGSALLARSARRVFGVDIAAEAVEHAQRQYPLENLHFLQGDCARIPLPDQSVDAVVSFETLEHHHQHEAMMLEVRRVLRAGGLLVISSPDRSEYSDRPGYQNPFHVRELYREEFEDLLRRHFPHVCLYGQRMMRGSVLFAGGRPSTPSFGSLATRTLDSNEVPGAVYWVALASDSELPDLGGGVLELPDAMANSAHELEHRIALARLIKAVAPPDSAVLAAQLRGEWYLANNGDILSSGIDPVHHWFERGAAEGRLPSADLAQLLHDMSIERGLRLVFQDASSVADSRAAEQAAANRAESSSLDPKIEELRDTVLTAERARSEMLQTLQTEIVGIRDVFSALLREHGQALASAQEQWRVIDGSSKAQAESDAARLREHWMATASLLEHEIRAVSAQLGAASAAWRDSLDRAESERASDRASDRMVQHELAEQIQRTVGQTSTQLLDRLALQQVTMESQAQQVERIDRATQLMTSADQDRARWQQGLDEALRQVGDRQAGALAELANTVTEAFEARARAAAEQHALEASRWHERCAGLEQVQSELRERLDSERTAVAQERSRWEESMRGLQLELRGLRESRIWRWTAWLRR